MLFLKNKKFFWYFFNLFLVLVNFFYIYKVIKQYSIKKVKPFKYKEWDDGFIYFTGYINYKKIFIKFDFLIKCLINEKINVEYIEKLKDKPFKTPKLLYFNDQTIIYEFIENTKPDQINLKNFIDKSLKYLKKNRIQHNDLLDRNFLFHKNKYYLIDWYFSVVKCLSIYKTNFLYSYYFNKLNLKLIKHENIKPR